MSGPDRMESTAAVIVTFTLLMAAVWLLPLILTAVLS